MTLCAQRKQQQLLNVPPSRIEMLNPYENSNVTKSQLDMRRKAEVLKYEQGNTKTNTLTKKQSYTQVMNGSSRPISNDYINKNINPVTASLASAVLACNTENIPKSSSESGVPNDYLNNVNTLYYDSNVPLYNYINPVLTRSYGIINPPLSTSVINYSVFPNATNDNQVSIVEFTDATTNPTYTLSLLNIPIALQIFGQINGNNVNITFDSIEINDISLRILYNSEIVTPNSDITYTFTPANNNYIVNVTNNANLNNTTFSGTVYIGNLSFYNIVLYASPGFIYSFETLYTINYPQSFSSGTNLLYNIKTSIISNVSLNYLIQQSVYNCEISFSSIQPTLPSTLGTFTVVAV